MIKKEFSAKNVPLETISDIITKTLRIYGYDKIFVDVETNPKDEDDRLFRIQAFKKGKFGDSTTLLPPIKFQIRGKSSYFLIAQQWINDRSDLADSIILGFTGIVIGMVRSLQRKRMEKKYWSLIEKRIDLLIDSKKLVA